MQKQHTPATDEHNIGVPSQYCSVCGDASTGIHFGGNSCESCKAFFRRSVQCSRFQNYKCSNDERCPVNVVTRKVCQHCRYHKCTKIGMKPKWVLSDQEREEKYGTRRKRFRETRTPLEDPDIYKYLSKEEKLLIEDIAHALYQSRATYPLQFPSQLNQYLKTLSTAAAPPTPPTANGAEKPPSPSANFLIVPIQRLVLFARILKDFDLFTEDDKVNLLKGSAIEIVVCSSSTLFNPKTHTFNNYLSRDQRAIVDEQVMPLDPLLKRLWGEDLFERTKQFLVSMSNLQIDEMTSTLLVPVILFSPDRLNIRDLARVKHLQEKYATLVLKYMHWRYGVEQGNQIYPKLLLQIVNIRTLSLSHSEVIQKVMSTSSVNPLVQEIAGRDELPRVRPPPTPAHSDQMETESLIDSDDDDETASRKKSRLSVDDDLDESDPRNIWTKRRKFSAGPETEITNLKQQTSNDDQPIKVDLLPTDDSSHLRRRPHDHQVPNFISTYPEQLNRSSSVSSIRHLPPKKQSSIAHRDSFSDPYYQSSPSPYTQLSPANSVLSPLSRQSYDDSRHPSSCSSQKSTDLDLPYLSLGSNRSRTPPIDHPGTALGAEEQQLLDAIHSHPNKRDLVLNLLRQMNGSTFPPASTVEHSTN